MQVPTDEEEASLRAQGYRLIAGIDEVGRGALAGPLVAAAVILPPGLDTPWLKQVRDSKLLTPQQRLDLYPYVCEVAVSWGTGAVSSEDIDNIGIGPANRLAMRQAVARLSPAPDFLLVDGSIRLRLVRTPQKAIVDGDAKCLSVACASILAKVTRDQLMQQLEGPFPGYGFARHKGYGTADHLAALRELGPCPIHRRSFAPVRQGLGLLCQPPGDEA